MTVALPRPLLRGGRSAVVAAHPLAVSAGLEVAAADPRRETWAAVR
jgi:hypothetical protein